MGADTPAPLDIPALVKRLRDLSTWPELSPQAELSIREQAANALESLTLQRDQEAGETMPLAEQVARLAHRGQVDKAGNPYIQHVERVVARVKGDEDAETVAWLHDVVEDTMFTAECLARFVDSPDILDAVDTLTRDKNFQTYAEYIDGVATSGNPLALKVKLADLADHLESPGCPETLRSRYVAALRILAPLGTRETPVMSDTPAPLDLPGAIVPRGTRVMLG